MTFAFARRRSGTRPSRDGERSRAHVRKRARADVGAKGRVAREPRPKKEAACFPRLESDLIFPRRGGARPGAFFRAGARGGCASSGPPRVDRRETSLGGGTSLIDRRAGAARLRAAPVAAPRPYFFPRPGGGRVGGRRTRLSEGGAFFSPPLVVEKGFSDETPPRRSSPRDFFSAKRPADAVDHSTRTRRRPARGSRGARALRSSRRALFFAARDYGGDDAPRDGEDDSFSHTSLAHVAQFFRRGRRASRGRLGPRVRRESPPSLAITSKSRVAPSKQ